MSQFQVTPEYVANAARSCFTTADSISAKLVALKSYVITLEGLWLGIASQTFSALMTDWDVFAKILNDALKDTGNGLNGNFVNYVDTENANIGNLVSINNDLPGAYL
jgi:WXG100 family type VII secretion target